MSKNKRPLDRAIDRHDAAVRANAVRSPEERSAISKKAAGKAKKNKGK